MNRCHCRGSLATITGSLGQLMTECNACGALASVRRIPVEQLELMDRLATRPPLNRAENRGERRRGLCNSVGCDEPTRGRALHCDDCVAVRAAECKRRYYERVMKPERDRLAARFASHQERARQGWKTRRVRRAA